MILFPQRGRSAMNAPQSPPLPVLPITKRRRSAARALQGLAIQQPAAALPRTRTRTRTRTRNVTRQAYRHAGVVALCVGAVMAVGTMVTFSILRDLSALDRSLEPVITAPLRP